MSRPRSDSRARWRRPSAYATPMTMADLEAIRQPRSCLATRRPDGTSGVIAGSSAAYAALCLVGVVRLLESEQIVFGRADARAHKARPKAPLTRP